MLRGDLKAARSKFQSALRRDPNNQTTLNNIKLLGSSQNFIERSANGEPCGSVDCGQLIRAELSVRQVGYSANGSPNGASLY